nr:leucine-rich repeat domain-containing protein [Lachnospiraceae bacterium]
HAFSNCSGLTSLTIPVTVKQIGEAAFEGCTGLKEIINHSGIEIDPVSQDPVVLNPPSEYSEEVRGDYKISYAHEIPFYGKVKPDPDNFGGITVSCNGRGFMVSKIKVNKKKGLILIKALDNADKDMEKALKQATKGAQGLPFTVRPYVVSKDDEVDLRRKDEGLIGSVKIKINGEWYKAKSYEWGYNDDTKSVDFNSFNLNGSYKLPD